MDETRRSPDDPLHTLHFAPDYTEGNPYQAMLYSGLGDIATYAAPVRSRKLIDHLESQASSPADPGIFHLHWTAPILQYAPDASEAERVLERFTAALRAFKARGGSLIWTIHNVLPHDATYRSLEIQLARTLVEHADRLHVLSSETADEVRELYPLDPDRTVVIGHSSYLGYYPSGITPAAAREQLGALPSEKVIIALGGIRPYKGFDRLIAAFDELCRVDPTLRLLVAGRPGRLAEVEELEDFCEAHPRITAFFDFVPDDELQVWFSAADMAVLPYLKVLNSGLFWLSQTFGLPIVGPREGAMRQFEDRAHVKLFDPGDDGDFAVVMAEGIRDFISDDNRDALRASSLATAAEWSPEAMASAFSSMVEELRRSRHQPFG